MAPAQAGIITEVLGNSRELGTQDQVAAGLAVLMVLARLPLLAERGSPSAEPAAVEMAAVVTVLFNPVLLAATVARLKMRQPAALGGLRGTPGTPAVTGRAAVAAARTEPVATAAMGLISMPRTGAEVEAEAAGPIMPAGPAAMAGCMAAAEARGLAVLHRPGMAGVGLTAS